jgi:hypothetical protein
MITTDSFLFPLFPVAVELDEGLVELVFEIRQKMTFLSDHYADPRRVFHEEVWITDLCPCRLTICCPLLVNVRVRLVEEPQRSLSDTHPDILSGV